MVSGFEKLRRFQTQFRLHLLLFIPVIGLFVAGCVAGERIFDGKLKIVIYITTLTIIAAYVFLGAYVYLLLFLFRCPVCHRRFFGRQRLMAPNWWVSQYCDNCGTNSSKDH